MTVAELVLEYLKVLVWPAVVAGALFYFRRPISKKIGGLKTFKMAGAEAEFEAAAHRVAIEAREASAEAESDREASPGAEAQSEPLDLEHIRSREIDRVRAPFRFFMTVSNDDASGAIAMAHRYLTIEARAAVNRIEGGFMGLKVTPLHGAVDLLCDGGLDVEWAQVARGLTRLAQQAAEDGIAVGRSAAIDFLTAAERLATELAAFGHDTQT